MPVYSLIDDPALFPDPEEAEPDGLLAVGGDLSLPRLVAAYSLGIFPWYGYETDILWWSPDPRLVLEPENLHISKSLKRVLNRGEFKVTLDTSFHQVIHGCAQAERPQGVGTWIIPDMIQAYTKLHDAGFAHSVETWSGNELVGGLYGVSLGRAFFGESMFFRKDDASKVAFVEFVRVLKQWEFHFIDCQQTTPHMHRFGAREIPRREFNRRLRNAIAYPMRRGRWIMPESDIRTPEE